MTTVEISGHFAEIYGASVSKGTVSRITDTVVAEMTEWSSRPLDRVCAAVFIDAIVIKVRDGQVANRPIYAAIGVTVDGRKDVLGLWAGTGGEGAKLWLSVLVDLRNRGVVDVFFVVCDGLKGLPDSVEAVWPQSIEVISESAVGICTRSGSDAGLRRRCRRFGVGWRSCGVASSSVRSGSRSRVLLANVDRVAVGWRLGCRVRAGGHRRVA